MAKSRKYEDRLPIGEAIREFLLAPVSFGHRAGVDVDSAPEDMWTPCRSSCGHSSVLTDA